MRNPKGMAAGDWGRMAGALAVLTTGLFLSGCGGDGATPGATSSQSQASIDAAGGRPLPTLEIPTQPVATPVPRARITEADADLAPPASPPSLSDARAGIADGIDSARRSAQDLRDRAADDAEAVRRKADQTIDRTQKRIESTADDLGRKVDGAIDAAERRVDQIHKKANDIQKAATDVKKKADDVRDGVEQTGKALRNLIGGGEGSRPKN